MVKIHRGQSVSKVIAILHITPLFKSVSVFGSLGCGFYFGARSLLFVSFSPSVMVFILSLIYLSLYFISLFLKEGETIKENLL